MGELSVTIDKVPARCKVSFLTCGPINGAYAENIDTGTTGPLVDIPDTHVLAWADLDPDGTVGVP